MFREVSVLRIVRRFFGRLYYTVFLRKRIEREKERDAYWAYERSRLKREIERLEALTASYADKVQQLRGQDFLGYDEWDERRRDDEQVRTHVREMTMWSNREGYWDGPEDVRALYQRVASLSISKRDCELLDYYLRK